MSYILKNTSGLVNTRVTDAGRQKMSQGNFNISYFQIGDSEVSYNTLPDTYSQFNTNILEPNFNSQNSSGVPESNKQNVKYPYYVDGITGNTYGIPFMDSIVSPVYNRAPLRGFFSGNTTADTISWSALTNNQYVINSNYVVDMSTLNCNSTIKLINAPCNPTVERGPSVGDFVTIFYDGKGMDDCYCDNLPTPTPTPSSSQLVLQSSPYTLACECNYYIINVDNVYLGYQYVDCNGVTQTGDIYPGGAQVLACTSNPPQVSGDTMTITQGGEMCSCYFFVIDCKFVLSGVPILFNGELNGRAYYNGFLYGQNYEFYWDISVFPNRWVFKNVSFPETIAYSLDDVPRVCETITWVVDDLTNFTLCPSFIGLRFSPAKVCLLSPSSGTTCNCWSFSPINNITVVYYDCNYELKSTYIPGGSTSEFCLVGEPSWYSVFNEENTSVMTSNSCSNYCSTSQNCGCISVEFTCLNGIGEPVNYTIDSINPFGTMNGKTSYSILWNDYSSLMYWDGVKWVIYDPVGEELWASLTEDVECPIGTWYVEPFHSTDFCFGDVVSLSIIQSACPTPTPSTTPTPTPTPEPSSTSCFPTPTPTPSKTPCLTPTPSRACPPLPPPDCKVAIDSCHPMMTYRITAICGDEITLDRPTPDFTWLNNMCYARVLIYPPNMTTIYDSITPRPHWADDVINYESICDVDQFDVKVWNMNIPWSENPAGLISSISKDYTNFGSVGYLGTKEYLGYMSKSGQTDSDSVYYYNSFDEKITVTAEEQKAISIVHYTNQTIDFFYGEKFALEPYDPSNPDDTTGQARNFKVHIPWIMWHKNENCCNGQTFWVDPPGFDDLTVTGSPLFKVHYIESTKNVDMNTPGIRYYHLWDNNPNIDGYPNRIGKVFPDQKIVVIDDEEIIAAMSYKSNRNWTLPSPKISLITPNICGTDNASAEGILTGDTEYMYVTYRFSDTNSCLNPLHCNYYSVVQGPNSCLPLTSQNVAVRFGAEFPCLNQPIIPSTTTTTTINPYTTTTSTFNPFTTTTTTLIGDCYCWQIDVPSPPVAISIVDCNGITNEVVLTEIINFGCSQIEPTSLDTIFTTNLGLCSEVVQCGGSPVTSTTTFYPYTTTTTTCPMYCDSITGFYANKFEIICQTVDGNGRPNSSEWKVIDFTSQLMSTMVNGYITQEGLTGNTFVITKEIYDDAPTYNLNNYIPLTPVGYTGTSLNFGDEYYFYGSLESDIQATIYEMRYKINLGQAEFQATSNPTWTQGTPSYVSEIALYDSDKTLMIISKLQSPVLRQGIQQFLVKFDF